VAAPEYVPTSLDELPRRGLPLPPAGRWVAERPAEVGPAQPKGRSLGTPGPDQGYALKLARQFHGRLTVRPPVTEHDAVVGSVAVAMRRAALFGRAPVVHDLDAAFRLWGFLGDAPADLVQLTSKLFASAAHDYQLQRIIADAVPDETLTLSHGEIALRAPAGWAELLTLD
jgi:hypothetical protein